MIFSAGSLLTDLKNPKGKLMKPDPKNSETQSVKDCLDKSLKLCYHCFKAQRFNALKQ